MPFAKILHSKDFISTGPPRKFETTQLSLRIINVQGWPGTVTPRASSWRGRRACEAASPGWRPWARSVAARWSSCAGARWSAASTCSPAHTVSRSVGTRDMYDIEHIEHIKSQRLHVFAVNSVKCPDNIMNFRVIAFTVAYFGLIFWIKMTTDTDYKIVNCIFAIPLFFLLLED